MTTLKGNKKHIELKRLFRVQMTNAENKLWLKIRGRRLAGFKFRRQHGIGPFITDFYCPEKKLAIEVDGDVHVNQAQISKDIRRRVYLENLGVRVVRYTNNNVVDNIDEVVEDIFEKLNE